MDHILFVKNGLKVTIILLYVDGMVVIDDDEEKIKK